jgi:hypothetical protein
MNETSAAPATRGCRVRTVASLLSKSAIAPDRGTRAPRTMQRLR